MIVPDFAVSMVATEDRIRQEQQRFVAEEKVVEDGLIQRFRLQVEQTTLGDVPVTVISPPDVRVATRCKWVEPRRRARSFVEDLLSGLLRKCCWTIAEHSGDATPDGCGTCRGRCGMPQRCVTTCEMSRWSHLGDADAMLVVDETGDVKKGSCSAGFQRQYTGTAGRIEYAQVGVFLTCTITAGHILIDRELYQR